MVLGEIDTGFVRELEVYLEETEDNAQESKRFTEVNIYIEMKYSYLNKNIMSHKS
jgi:uncharacterized OsmC-like protein